MSRRQIITLAVLLVVLAAVCAWRLAVGDPERLGFPGTRGIDPFVWDLRLVRLAGGVIVGAALGVGGAMLQSLLRNSLASPDLLGLTAGAGLAVMIAVYASNRAAGALTVPPAVQGGAALVGAGVAFALVYALSRRRGVIDTVTMVLVGVILSVIAGAATVLLQRLMPDRGLTSERWFFGQLSDDRSWWTLGAAGALTLIGIALGVRWGGAMDAAALGDDEARSVGVRVGRLRAGLFVVSGVLTAAAVVVAGPVGFVGLVCPHVVRLGAGPAHRVVVVGAALAGAALVVGSDAGIKSFVTETGRLPLGVVTALLGGPVFLWLLMREIRR